MNNPLPFNFSPIADNFRWISPSDDFHFDAMGIWVLLNKGSLILEKDCDYIGFPKGEIPDTISLSGEPLCFGLWDGSPVYVCTAEFNSKDDSFLLEPFNASRDILDDSQLTLGGIASSIHHWHESSIFCGYCGGSTKFINGEFGKICNSCGKIRFPSVHPCAIVVVENDGRFLMVRKAEWQAGRYSLVAGFANIGESIEECAVREVKEETGIKIKNLKYFSSQFWPFPSQLMAGFYAEYESGEIICQEDEIEDAKWLLPEEITGSIPGRRSMARKLIDTYILQSKRMIL